MKKTKRDDRNLLLRLLEDDLAEDEARAVRGRLLKEPGLQKQLEKLQAMRHALADSRAESFAPNFSYRVVRKLSPYEGQSAEAFYESLRWLFGRTAVATLLLAIFVGAYNVVEFQQLGLAATFFEALLGLPSDSVMDALSYNTW